MEKEELISKLSLLLDQCIENYDFIENIIDENKRLKKELNSTALKLNEADKEIERIKNLKKKALKLMDSVMGKLE